MPFAPTCPACGCEEIEIVGGDACVVRSMRIPEADDD
jgi:Zn finger protein HypA/HybF involved in hydrogenase expression